MSDTKVTVFPEVPESVDNAIKNVTDLPTKGIGQTLSDCWFLAFGGISQLADKRRIKYAHELENFKNELQDSLSKVPEEFKKEPSTQIVLKTLEEAKYCVEEKELRDLFTALLTSATDSRQVVHPAFAYIISQMNSNDAKIVKSFAINDTRPICDIVVYDGSPNSYQYYYTNLFIGGPADMSIEEKTFAISSLIHLGILEILPAQKINSETLYGRFRMTEIFQNAKQKFSNCQVDLKEKAICLTSLGKLFISCCLPDNASYVLK